MEPFRVDVEQLRLGMFVTDLDRPWVGTPFMFQGFRIESDIELGHLRRLCSFVFLDPDQGDVPNGTGITDAIAPKTDPKARMERFQAKRLELTANAIPARYPIKVPVEEEIPRAEEIRSRAVNRIQEVFHSVGQGNVPNTRGAMEIAEEMVHSIIRNPDAMVWLSQLKSKDEYTALHSINVCALSVTFGRHLGLSKEQLVELGIGALLHDIGKLRVPNDVLNKPDRLTAQEFRLIRLHPVHGRNLLGKTDHRAAQSVLDIAYSHHERNDGRGYPRGLKGSELSLYSRMVAIVDVYDALNSDRVYHAGLGPDETLARIYEWSQRELDAELVQHFIRSLGRFPVGTLVELSNGEVGIVIEVNHQQPRRPKVLLVLAANKTPHTIQRIIDLSGQGAKFGRGSAPCIDQALAPQSYGIDSATLAAAHS
jgi:HD-GYP domain-containing protein (c-di-GMP phosphodiesterase class II)